MDSNYQPSNSGNKRLAVALIVSILLGFATGAYPYLTSISNNLAGEYDYVELEGEGWVDYSFYLIRDKGLLIGYVESQYSSRSNLGEVWSVDDGRLLAKTSIEGEIESIHISPSNEYIFIQTKYGKGKILMLGAIRSDGWSEDVLEAESPFSSLRLTDESLLHFSKLELTSLLVLNGGRTAWPASYHGLQVNSNNEWTIPKREIRNWGKIGWLDEKKSRFITQTTLGIKIWNDHATEIASGKI